MILLSSPAPETLFFDLMGTCLNWQGSIMPTTGETFKAASSDELDAFTLDWRQEFFDEIHARFEDGLSQEDIDETHRRKFIRLAQQHGWHVDEDGIQYCVEGWHNQAAWSHVRVALPILSSKFDCVVLTNGTTRLQLDVTSSSALRFGPLLSSELLGLTKPDRDIYIRAMELVQRKPEGCVMVAAHAYNLRAATAVGMRTVYIQRHTEHIKEDMDKVRQEIDVFIGGHMVDDGKGESTELVRLLGLEDLLPVPMRSRR